ncbi:heterokaryon incompatibility het-6 [Apiospora arundinis]
MEQCMEVEPSNRISARRQAAKNSVSREPTTSSIRWPWKKQAKVKFDDQLPKAVIDGAVRTPDLQSLDLVDKIKDADASGASLEPSSETQRRGNPDESSANSGVVNKADYLNVSPEGATAEIYHKGTREERERRRRRDSAPPIKTSFPTSFHSPTQTTHGIFEGLGGDEIRLVRLLPAHTSTIRCQIIHTSLVDPPAYTALSYTWGDADDTVDITVDGFKVKITASLQGALQALRKPHDSVLVWADAICINQSDKTELSSQVQLMTRIYGEADSVAIWLGPESDDSQVAMNFTRHICGLADSPEKVDSWIEMESHEPKFTALVNLFERDYWSRVWVVQEVLNARSVTVCCGDKSISWKLLQELVALMERHEEKLNLCFPPGFVKGSRNRQSYAHILISGGPANLDILSMLGKRGAQSLLEVLRLCRTKHTTEPRDKVFGVLGILPEDVQLHFPPDYNASLRQVYTDVVDYLLHTTRRLDVICEAIYFPLHARSTALPTWVPDWSHVPQTAGLGRSYEFSASGDTQAIFSFPGSRQRTKLKFSAISLGAVEVRGIAVGTFCGLDDSLMAFLHWRSKMLTRFFDDGTAGAIDEKWTEQDEAFCRTISLGPRRAVWEDWKEDQWSDAWTDVCYHSFVTLIAERLPSIRVDDRLQACIDANNGMGNISIAPGDRRKILQERCESRMMGRCFFITEEGKMGMGTGFLEVEDIICVPLGCCTPVVLRPEGKDGEYRLVGDCYVDGYMDGEAVQEWENDGRKLEEFVLR